VYIDRRGYADSGAAIEATIERILDKPIPIISANGHQVFFDLIDNKHPACILPPDISSQQIMERSGLAFDESGVKYRATLADGVDFTRTGSPVFLSSVDGLSGAESWGRWSDASTSPAIRLRFADPLPANFVLHLRAKGFGPNVGHPAQVVIGDEIRSFLPTGETSEYTLPFTNLHGATLITIKPARPASPSELGINIDGRKLGLGMQRLWIEATQ